MKILIFSHKSDIDGMGGVILSKLYFSKVDYVLCEAYNLQDKIKPYFDNKKIYIYDYIFITDMWLEEPTLSKIHNDKLLNGKIFIFDHHESALSENYNKYNFVTLKISDEVGRCAGTSLFYEYLIKKRIIKTENKAIKDFVELTRQYDTWEWTWKYHNKLAHDLTFLFYAVGAEAYIDLMVKKLKKATEFKFNTLEKNLIKNKELQINERMVSYSKKIVIKRLFNLDAAVVFINYEDRNDLVEYLRDKKYPADFVMMIALDKGAISYRGINDNVNVRLIAKAMGGKGHDKAASSPITIDKKEKMIDVLIKD